MRTSLALRWKALVRKIHPPLPMTPREERMLLKALNASFKEDISQRHPTTGVINANAHVKSILTSPLLVHRSAPMNRGNVTATEISPKLPEPQRGPIKVFETYFSRGTMTLREARLCLRALRKQCQASVHPPTAMQHTGAGATTLQWLWSSGLSDSFQFLKDLSFVQEVVPFLIAEGKSSVPNSWMEHGFATLAKELSTDNLGRLFGHINLAIVEAEIRLGAGLASAVTGFVNAFRKHPGDRSHTQLYSIYGRTGRRLVHAMENAQVPPKLPTATYSALRASAQAWSKQNSFSSAWLALHDPVSPSVTETVSYLENLDFDTIEDLEEQRYRPTVNLSLKAAGALMDANRTDDAARVMDILETRFPTHIGYPATGVRSKGGKWEAPSAAEALSTRLLQNLVAD